MFSDFNNLLSTGYMMSDSRFGYVLGILLCLQLMTQAPLSAATKELDLSKAVVHVVSKSALEHLCQGHVGITHYR